MTTLEELAAIVNSLQGQQAVMVQEVQRLTVENQMLRAATTQPAPGLAEIASAVGQAVQAAMARGSAVGAIGAPHRSLIDIKGLGKPPVFRGDASKFNEWLRKTEAFLVAAYGSTFRPVVEWVEDQETAIVGQDLDDQFGDTGHEPVGEIFEKNAQLHVALLALTEGESFDIVLGAAPSGLEALRRLIRRWDPLSGGKRRVLLRQILVPDRCKLQDLPAGIEKWEELVRRYEKRRAGGTVTSLDDDIKTSALEALVPQELEQHLAMNRARLPTYDNVRAEIQAYIEARRSQFAFRPAARNPDAMDVDSFSRKGGKKGGKGDGRGNNKGGKNKNGKGTKGQQNVGDRECWNCGKKGHLSAECWSKPRGNQPSAKGPHSEGGKHQPNSTSKGKKYGKGKGASSLEDEAQGEFQEPVLAGSFELSAVDENRRVRFAHLNAEGWLRWTYDTGAAITAFPLDASMGIETPPNGASYKTASGELIPDHGGLSVRGSSESGYNVILNGRKADVHKTLVSAGMVHKKGHVAFLDAEGGYLLPGWSALSKKIQQIIRQEVWKEKAAVKLYQEAGIYVGYTKVEQDLQLQAAPATQAHRPALCPVSGPLPGGHRQPPQA